MTFRKFSSCVSAVFVLFFMVTDARGGEFLPESHNQRYLTYGLLFDHQSSLGWRGAGKAFGSISANVPLWQPSGEGLQPQLMFTADVIAGWFFEDGAFNSDENDSVMKLAWNTWWSPNLLISFGWEHVSGHTSDDTHSHEIDKYDAGIEYFPLRVIYDGFEEKKIRIGGTFRPIKGDQACRKVRLAFRRDMPRRKAMETLAEVVRASLPDCVRKLG